MVSPFQFGKTVSGSAFTNRRELLKILKDNLLSGISTILISPRRWGKSSLVQKCMDDFFREKKGYRIIMVDLFRIRNEEEFFENYAKEVISSTSNKLEEAIGTAKQFLKNIIPRISLSAVPGNDFSLSFDVKELRKNRGEVLDLPEKICRKKKINIIICIDEFQNIINYKNTKLIQKELRSSWQNHKNVTYCLYGSKRHIMSDIFNDSSSPFYRFGNVLFLEKIERKHWKSFISKSFRQTNKNIADDYCEYIAHQMGNHPYYVQQLSYIVWNLTENQVDTDIIKTALKQLVDMNRPFFIKEFESLNNSQVNLLKAICAGEIHLNSNSILSEYRLGTSGNVSKNKKILEQDDIIEIDSSGILFTDPVFEIWFRQSAL